jgi:hypothetical protein
MHLQSIKISDVNEYLKHLMINQISQMTVKAFKQQQQPEIFKAKSNSILIICDMNNIFLCIQRTLKDSFEEAGQIS